MPKNSISPLLILSIIGFTGSASNMMLNPIISIYARSIGTSIFEVGLIVSAFSMISMFSKPMIGFYVGLKRIFLMPTFGLFLMVISPLAMAFANTPLLLAVFRVIQGLGNSMLWSPSMTIVALISPDKRNENISMYTTTVSLGMFLGPTIGAISMDFFGGIRNTFLIASFTPLIGFLLSFKLLQRRETIVIHDANQESKTKFSLSVALKRFSLKMQLK